MTIERYETTSVASTDRCETISGNVRSSPTVAEVVAAGAGGISLTGLTATATELNRAADISVFTQELTASGAVASTTRNVELNHASVVVAATYTVVPGVLFSVKDTSATGTAAHTLTLTGGTFNGSATVATLNARDEYLLVQFDSAGRGTVILNQGSVALS